MHMSSTEWLPVASAPTDHELEVCVLDYDGMVHALTFPCHKDGTGWVDHASSRHLDIQPMQWRSWKHSAH